MVDGIDLGSADIVVEYGPGTGVFTEEILRNLKPDATYLGFEVNSSMARHLRARFPQITVYEDCAATVRRRLHDHQHGAVDVIISGLPWAIFPNELQDRILSESVEALADGGVFATFAYLQGLLLPAGQRFRNKLTSVFSTVETSRITWLNLPPAIVYRCTK
jgi:phospholipid N-methyltransferase